MKKIIVSLLDLALGRYVGSWEIFHRQSFLIYFLASLLYILTTVQSLLILKILFYSAISISVLSSGSSTEAKMICFLSTP